MTIIKKIFAIAFIAVFLASIPLAFAENKSDIVQVVIVLKHEDNFVKPGGGSGGSSGGGDYKLWFRGYKTDIPVTLNVYTENTEGISKSSFIAAITASANAWDDKTSAQLVGSIVPKSGSKTPGKDNENIIIFGNYPTNGVIAVTYAWVDRATSEIIEFDIMFDTDFTWGDASSNTALMDLQNIATHELGHGFNLSDLYAASKSALTMYGYSTEGDIAKRTLAPGDIAGIQAVFGA
jgi:hypothetical protein